MGYSGGLSMYTVAECCLRNVQLYGEKAALVYEDGHSFTFLEQTRRAAALATRLDDLGVGPGSRLAVLAPTCAELLDWIAVAAFTGRVIIPLNWRLSAREIRMVLEDANPQVFACHAAFAEVGQEAAKVLPGHVPQVGIGAEWGNLDVSHEDIVGSPLDSVDWSRFWHQNAAVQPDDPFLIIYTSGTTGRPKGVVLDQGGQAANSMTVIIEMALQDTDSLINCLPLFHIGATSLIINFLMRGCTNYLMPRFDADIWLETVQNHRVTCAVLVPTLVTRILNRLEEKEYDLSSLRTLYYSGAPMPEQEIKRALEKLGPCLYQAYGCTEAGPSITALHKEDHKLEGPEVHRLRSCGRPVADVAVDICDDNGVPVPPGEVGLVWVNSRAVMKEYLGQPEITAETLVNGWLKTGDLARRDEDGYVYLVGRQKDLIITGGENVYPGEVEACLREHPDVEDAAVVGLPDPEWGERVAALVVPKPGSALTPDDVSEFCRKQIAGYKRPRVIAIAQELPRNTLGKVDKAKVRELLGGQTKP